MSEHAESKVEERSWDQQTYRETEGWQADQGHVVQGLTGDLAGEGTTEFLMCYRPDGTATFIGPQEIVGTLAGRSGAFVVHAQGVFEGGEARSDWSVVDGSGTGELRGLRGQGTGLASATTVSLSMDYDLD